MNTPYQYPDWFAETTGLLLPREGEDVTWAGRPFAMRGGFLRDTRVWDEDQLQTRDTFAYKWKQTGTYTSEAFEAQTRSWLVERYGDWSDDAFWSGFGNMPLVLDAGCGSGATARLLIGDAMDRIRYVGVDVSDALDVAAKAFPAEGMPAALVQGSLLDLPFEDGVFDVVLSEGVLHHTPSTRDALHAVARKLKPDGLFAFYVYRRKSPAREFTDDHIRNIAAGLSPEDAWAALMPLTKLGKTLGDLNITVDVPEDVDVLGIPKGPIDLQRLFYWHFCKMYYRPEYSLDEMNHVNFDWFTPAYAHRQSVEEVSTWCADAGLRIDHINEEDAGITVFAYAT